MPTIIAEVLVGHPTQSPEQQLHLLSLEKAITLSEHTATLSALARAKTALEDPEVEGFTVQCSGGRSIRVRKYAPTEAEPFGVTFNKVQYRNAEEEFNARVAEHRRLYASTQDQAINAVASVRPDLWNAYTQDQRYGRNGQQGSVTKAAELTPEMILGEARARVAKAADRSMVQVLADLVMEHGGQREYLDTYRHYLSGQGLTDHDTQVAKAARPERTVYDAMQNAGYGCGR